MEGLPPIRRNHDAQAAVRLLSAEQKPKPKFHSGMHVYIVDERFNGGFNYVYEGIIVEPPKWNTTHGEWEYTIRVKDIQATHTRTRKGEGGDPTGSVNTTTTSNTVTALESNLET